MNCAKIPVDSDASVGRRGVAVVVFEPADLRLRTTSNSTLEMNRVTGLYANSR